jgi:transposase
MFVVLDNTSIHRSKKTINTITRDYPTRIVFVFQPTNSPHLNLIVEVRRISLQSQSINNSTFRSESDIGSKISDVCWHILE